MKEINNIERPTPEVVMMMADNGAFIVSKDGGATFVQYISYEEASWMEEERFALYKRRVILNFLKLLFVLVVLLGVLLTAFALSL